VNLLKKTISIDLTRLDLGPIDPALCR
jgi:hypothetical protein